MQAAVYAIFSADCDDEEAPGDAYGARLLLSRRAAAVEVLHWDVELGTHLLLFATKVSLYARCCKQAVRAAPSH